MNLLQLYPTFTPKKKLITRTNDQDQLKEFIEKVNENHSWLQVKIPVLKIIALAKLKKFEEAKKEYRKSLFRFPSNKKNLEDARRAVIFINLLVRSNAFPQRVLGGFFYLIAKALIF